MDKHGIGTDATHAEHIETVKQRQYIGITNDKLIPGTNYLFDSGAFSFTLRYTGVPVSVLVSVV
jgi:hypothetical protein